MPRLITEHQKTLWTPQRIATSDLYGFWSADDSSNITLENTDRVIQWNDLSGNGNHLTRASEDSKRPYYTASNKYVLFDGANSLSTSSALFTNTNPLHAYCGFAFNSGAANGSILWGQHQTSTNNRTSFFYNSAGEISYARLYGGSISYNFFNYSSLVGQTNFCLVKIYNPASNGSWTQSFLYDTGQTAVKDQSITSPTTANYLQVPFTVGGSFSNSAYTKAYLQFILLAKVQLSTDIQQKIEGWWAYVFNKKSALATSHPYKIYPPLL